MKPLSHSSFRLAVLGAALLCCGNGLKAQTSVAFLVLPEFVNALTNSPAQNPTDQNSLALYSGSVGLYSPPGSGSTPVIPANAAGTQLGSCGFGQMLAQSVPFPDFEFETIRLAQEKLYPSATDTTRELVAGSGAAFRYKDLLYERTNTNVRAQFENITTYFGKNERKLVTNGISILRNALKYSPLDKHLRNALLDAYYDWVVAEAQYVKKDLSDVAMYRLGIVPPTSEFIIDDEIAGYTNVLQKYEGILQEYGNLFLETGGVDVSALDKTAPAGITLGQWIFQQEQPQRNQMAARFWDTNGILTSVPVRGSTNSMLFAGYKDYVALVGVLRDYAQSAAELVKLYGMRGRAAVLPGQKDDKALGLELVQSINDTEIATDTKLFDTLLPNGVPPESQLDASGVRAARSAVLAATAELNKAGAFLCGTNNLLGFDPDFLVLISTFPVSSTEHLWDSYDALRGWLGSLDDSDSLLGRAKDTLDTAWANYRDYKGYADQVFNEMSANENSYSKRYREICGYNPGDEADPYPSPVPAGRYPPVDPTAPPSHYNNPRAGSELRETHQNIERCQARAVELAKAWLQLSNQSQTASKRLGASSNRIDNIEHATLYYKSVITTERDNITGWSALQAGTQAAYDTFSDCMSIAGGAGLESWGLGTAEGAIAGTAIMGAINTAVQTAGEVEKGKSQKALDLAAANFDKDLAMADAEQNIYQAGEEQRNIDREIQSQVLTAQDNQSVLRQEMEQMHGLQREMQQARVSRDQNNAGLAGRYYADPIHYLRAQNSMLQADYAFRAAQRWVFFVLRALEYKYNMPFVYYQGGLRWELSSLFTLRNADELRALLAAMDGFNTDNLSKLNGRSIVTDKISLKDDVWGRTYPNGPERLAEFRKNVLAAYTNSVFEINLNTLRLSKELVNGALFIGAKYSTNGTLINRGRYLDKVEYIKVKFVDNTCPSMETRPGTLSYGGDCYVRPEIPSCTGNDTTSKNELRKFPFRYFKMGTDTNGVLKVTSSADQSADLDIVFWNQPDKSIEPTDSLNPEAFQSTFLRERSVATTQLKVIIPADEVDPDTLQDIHIYIRHRYALRTECQ